MATQPSMPSKAESIDNGGDSESEPDTTMVAGEPYVVAEDGSAAEAAQRLAGALALAGQPPPQLTSEQLAALAAAPPGGLEQTLMQSPSLGGTLGPDRATKPVRLQRAPRPSPFPTAFVQEAFSAGAAGAAAQAAAAAELQAPAGAAASA
jgi:hypothetical protein